MNAWVRSAFACSTDTPGFRRTIISVQSHTYRCQYPTDDPPDWCAPNVVIGTYATGAFPSVTPVNLGGATPMIVQTMLSI